MFLGARVGSDWVLNELGVNPANHKNPEKAEWTSPASIDTAPSATQWASLEAYYKELKVTGDDATTEKAGLAREIYSCNDAPAACPSVNASSNTE